MVIAAVNLLEKTPNPDEAEIRNGLAGKSLSLHGLHEDFRVGGASV